MPGENEKPPLTPNAGLTDRPEDPAVRATIAAQWFGLKRPEKYT